MTENILSEWSLTLMVALADAGVSRLVSSPGSRSTPFVAAALREPRIELISVIDERAAAFVALGHARITGAPSVLLCTSGSAPAHYFPAIIEANAAGLPLVVLSADRPFELTDCGAPQTIDQTKLFGGHVRKFVELGTPVADEVALRAVVRMAIQAVAASHYPAPGVVHINARASKPLEPVVKPLTEAGRAWEKVAATVRARGAPVVSIPREVTEPAALDEIAAVIQRAERGVLVVGPAPPSFAAARSTLFDLARRSGFPLLCELPSQLRLAKTPPGVVTCDGFDAALRSPSFRKSNVPDVIVQIGGPPTSSGWEAFGEARAAHRIVIAPRTTSWLDPTGSASHVLFGEVADVLAGLVARLPDSGRATAWADKLGAVGAACVAAAEQLVAEADGLSEGVVARTLMDSLPDGGTLVLGNSLPLRSAEAWARRTGADLTVLCQRGANGIDGLVAGAVGAAQASARPTTLFLGDVSLLHDVSSLGLARAVATPFVVVVVQNGGGRIFAQLPLATGSADAESGALRRQTLAHVSTEHAIDFEPAAALFGIAYRRVSSREALASALTDAHARAGATLVEVVVPAEGAAIENRRLWSLTAESLSTSI